MFENVKGRSVKDHFYTTPQIVETPQGPQLIEQFIVILLKDGGILKLRMEITQNGQKWEAGFVDCPFRMVVYPAGDNLDIVIAS